MGKKSIIKLLIGIIIGALVFLGMGFYFDSLSKPKHIIFLGIKDLNKIYSNYLSVPYLKKIGGNFTMDSSIDFDLDSEYYSKQTDLESIKKYNLIHNLNNMNTSFHFVHDQTNKTLLFELNENIGSIDILHTKTYINNSTLYYKISGINSHYVNNGTSNYFESLREKDALDDNYNYLFHFLLDSSLNNIDKKNISEENVTMKIGNHDKKVHKVSIDINNKDFTIFLNNILKDLKKDKEANYILKNVYPDLLKKKFKSKDIIIKDQYIINIYTTKFFYKPLKYEIINKNNLDGFSFEKNSNGGLVEYFNNNKVIYKMNCIMDKNIIKAPICDENDKKIGQFQYEKYGENITINYNFDDSTNKYDFIYTSKFNSKSIDKKCSFKIVKNKVSRLNGTVSFFTNYNKNTRIDEEIKDSVLYSTLKEEEKDSLERLKDIVRERLERKYG